jgi:hypothetical protein
LQPRGEVREGDLRQRLGRVREGDHLRARAAQAAEDGAHLRARSQVDRGVVLGEALEQRRPVSDPAVELRGRVGAARGQPAEVDARAAGQVLEPGVPERPRVAEHAVEVDG